MSNISKFDDVLGIVKQAGELLKDENKVALAAKTGQRLRAVGSTGGALTQHTSKMTIMSRIFFDQSISDEMVIPNLTKRIHEWYAAQCIAAIGLARMVDGKNRVEDYLKPLNTGANYKSDVIDSILKAAAGQESFIANMHGESALENMGPFYPKDPEHAKLINRLASDNDKLRDENAKQREQLGAQHTTSSMRPVNPSEYRLGPLGELFEITLVNPTNKDLSVKLPLFIQMQPTIMPTAVAPRFIDRNVMPSIWQRWTQRKAGEISFWKDFVFAMDLARRDRSFLKDPEAAHAMEIFLKTVNQKNRYALKDSAAVVQNTKSTISSNLANTVMVFSEETVARARVEGGIDLHRESDRNRYFSSTYTMIVCIVDPIHQRVTMYFNGLEGEINSPYQEFKPKDSKFDPNEFMMALQSFTSGGVGRVR